MTIAPESIEVDKCYLIKHGQVARVMRLSADGRVDYAFRSSAIMKASEWTRAITDRESFSRMLKREVPCDWMREGHDEE